MEHQRHPSDATNPWLRIPAAEYEAHMALPEVAQSQALNALFASALVEHAPASVAIFGCATGNGLEHIDTSRTRRVAAVDINSEYLAILKGRYGSRLHGLEVVAADFTSPHFAIQPVSMVFAGLVFEYIGVRDALLSIGRSLAPEGTLVAVLQLPSSESAPVTATPFTSLELLAPLLRLVSPKTLASGCAAVGLRQLKTETVPLRRGKAFHVGTYRKAGC